MWVKHTESALDTVLGHFNVLGLNKGESLIRYLRRKGQQAEGKHEKPKTEEPPGLEHLSLTNDVEKNSFLGQGWGAAGGTLKARLGQVKRTGQANGAEDKRRQQRHQELEWKPVRDVAFYFVSRWEVLEQGTPAEGAVTMKIDHGSAVQIQ